MFATYVSKYQKLDGILSFMLLCIVAGNGREYSRTFQQRYKGQRFDSDSTWTRDSSWPRTPGRGAERDAPAVAQADTLHDDYDADVPYGVDTSSPKGRVSTEAWQQRDS